MTQLFERHELRPKTHRGVHARFAAEVMSDTALPRSLSEFLVFAYRFKQSVDYDTERTVDDATAGAAITEAADFIAHIKQALEPPADR